MKTPNPKNLNSTQNNIFSNSSQKTIDLETLAKQIVSQKMDKEKFREFVDNLGLKPMEIEDLKDIVKKIDYQTWLMITGEIDNDDDYFDDSDYVYTPELGYDPCEEDDCE